MDYLHQAHYDARLRERATGYCDNHHRRALTEAKGHEKSRLVRFGASTGGRGGRGR
jgi:hypothetical protein